jgi:membrane protease YdiL (CAAX protease family)
MHGLAGKLAGRGILLRTRPDLMSVIAIHYTCQSSLLLIGAVALWRLVILPKIRRIPITPLLLPWEISGMDFFRFIWVVFAGLFAGSLCASLLFKFYPLTGDTAAMAGTAAGQIGGLIGVALFEFFLERQKPTEPPPRVSILVSGFITFAIGLCVAALASLLWQSLLRFFDIAAERQDLVRMFREADTPLTLWAMIILACIGAPAAEELLFRRGIFRYARTRLPRWAALLLPACLFGAVHGNLAGYLPLVALGVVFALAYERTGRIGTSIVAHALFNLNTVLYLLGGGA